MIIPILMIAAVNLRRVLPALSNFKLHHEVACAWAIRFRGLLRAETGLGLTILVLVAVLTSLPPASAVAAGPMNLTKTASEGVVSVRLSPNKMGQNHITVSLQDASGHNVTDARPVVVYLKMRDMDMGLESAPAVLAADGTYGADVDLSMAGRWSFNMQASSSDSGIPTS